MAAKKTPPRDSANAEVDALFRLPLGEFTGARNALAARLKKEGRGGEATAVKGLEKPSLAAWAVNQIYWDDRKEFDGLLAATAEFRAAQAGRRDPRPLLEARRKALLRLARKTLDKLREAGARPGPETARRVTNTLEALATLSPATDLVPGRLTRDVDPPGFEALAGGAMASPRGAGTQASRVLPFRPAAKAPAKDTARDRERRAAEARQSKQAEREAQAAARRAAQEAEQALRAARRAAEQAARALAEAKKKAADAQSVAQARAEEARNLERAASSAAEAVAAAERQLDRARAPRRE
ncbi:MAG TPA: hypothetical protein VFE44_05275 [Thermoanaerobaculia bacterium]|nr:hypothetical protein [Thermoanaerobaculia bacterium]